MTVYAEEDAPGRAYDAGLMRRFSRYLRPYAGLVAATVLLMLLRIAADLAGPLILRAAVDGPVARKDFPGLLSWAGLLAAAIAAMALFEFLYVWTMSATGQGVLYDLRTGLFSHLQRLPASFFDRTPVGRLVVRVTNDVENLNELFTSGLVEFLADVLMIAGVIATMFVLDWRLALVTLTVLPPILAVTLAFRKTARERYREMRRRIGLLNSCLNESVGGMRTIQVFGREKMCLERFQGLNGGLCDSAIAAIRVYAFFYPAIELFAALASALLVWFGGMKILEGTLTFGSFIAFWYCAQKLFQPVREIAEKYNVLQAAMASAERLFRILDTPAGPADRPDAVPAPPFRGAIEFRNVGFSYDGRTPVLEDVSFRVEPGQSLAIVGLTGAGKTTLLNLLLRFYDPSSGAVLVDGRDLRDYQARSVRRQMGLVLQDVFLFAGSVEENIRLGDPSISRERVEEAARTANAEAFIRRLPAGYGTDVMERGAVLSAGERQRLSFARALAFDPRILVLDEATSSVDAESERMIQEGLRRLLRGRTSLVVAHRLSTVRHADRILVIHRGRVREEGTHAELLKRDGFYRKLYRIQFERPAGRPEAPPLREEEAPPVALDLPRLEAGTA
jgi:ATP-binding cassette subfamily B protein